MWRAELELAGDSIVVFRDSAFDDDVAKTNLAFILKQRRAGEMFGVCELRSCYAS